MRKLRLESLVVLGLVVAFTGVGLCGEPCMAGKISADRPAGNGVTLGLTAAAGGDEDVVAFRAEITNSGKKPMSLSVCPEMLLCCVKGLHPLIAYGDTGMGLMDVCKKKNPAPHEVFLPVGSSFAFDMDIPIERLPDEARGAGKEITIQLCYELSGNKLTHSNPVTVALRE